MAPGYSKFWLKSVNLSEILTIGIPQSHRPNRHKTDLKPTKIIKFGERSVYSRYWFGFVGLVSVYVRADKFVGERSFKYVWKLSPRQIVGYMSVWCRFCRGAFGDVSVLIRPPIVYGLSVLDRLCIGHMSADLTPIQDRIKSDITPNCVESADTFPNQNRRVPDISRNQTECKPTTVCGVIPTYKSTQKFPESISSPKWRQKMALLEVCHN